MTGLEFIQYVNDALRGADDDPPASGTDEYDLWMRTASRLNRTRARDISKQWRSDYQVLNLGTITASSTPTFDLDDTFLGAAAGVYAINPTTDARTDFVLIQPQNTDYLNQAVYIAGNDPQVLTFTKEITSSENYVGATLYLPAYVLPDDITADGDTIVCDDPDWLVVATAAKIAFSDITYEDKTADLNAEANFLYSQMTKNNRRGTAGNPRTSRYNTVRIGERHGRN